MPTSRKRPGRRYVWYFIFAIVIILSISYGICIATFKVFPYTILQSGYSFLFLRQYTEYTQPSYFSTDVSSLIHIHNQSDISLKRQQLISLIWKGDGFPPDIPSVAPIDDKRFAMDNLERVDTFTVRMRYGVDSIVYILEPKQKKHEAILYANGHENGILPQQEMVEELVKQGFTVAVVSMPLYGDNNQPTVLMPGVGNITLTYHNQFMLLESQQFSPLVYFVQPLALTTNYLESKYSSVSMVGFSGGGWETTLYSAIDPRVQHSYPVAGSIPAYLRSQRDWGDYEQFSPQLYDVANYLDLYLMASSADRTQLQVLNRYDSCCFAGEGYTSYAATVSRAASSLGGSFRVMDDNTTTIHQVSDFTRKLVVSELLKIYPDAPQ